MSKKSHYFVLASVLFVGIYVLYQRWTFSTEVDLPGGVFAPRAPLQTLISEPNVISLKKDNAFVQTIATYDIKAKVILKKRYSDDAFSKYSPFDLALGWQDFSNEDVLKHYDFSQSGRWYYYKPANESARNYSVVDQSANVHIVPATSSIEKQIENIGHGSIVRLRGYLVNVRDSDNVWKTSLSRFDTGAGSCEILYVKSVEVIINTAL